MAKKSCINCLEFVPVERAEWLVRGLCKKKKNEVIEVFYCKDHKPRPAFFPLIVKEKQLSLFD